MLFTASVPTALGTACGLIGLRRSRVVVEVAVPVAGFSSIEDGPAG
jgi:hypothetical protein